MYKQLYDAVGVMYIQSDDLLWVLCTDKFKICFGCYVQTSSRSALGVMRKQLDNALGVMY